MNVYRIKNFEHYKFNTVCENKQIDMRYLAIIFDKKNKEILSKLESNGSIFEYHYINALKRDIIKLEVFKNNTAVIKYDKSETTTVIKPDFIEDFYAIVKKYCEEYKSEDYYLEDSCVLDGYDYEIYLSDGNDYYLCNVDNLQIYDEASPKRCRFVLMLKEIFALLKQAGIEHEKFIFQ